MRFVKASVEVIAENEEEQGEDEKERQAVRASGRPAISEGGYEQALQADHSGVRTSEYVREVFERAGLCC